MAGAAIGVSHIVHSTRAGADFGWQLIWIVLLINLFKYPFFEFGHRYAAATGESLLHGYRRMGRPYLWIFLILNMITSVISIAGVTLVTAFLANYLFGVSWDLSLWSLILLGVSVVIIGIGRYPTLDFSIKLIMAILVLATFAATLVAVVDGPAASAGVTTVSPWTMAGFGFVIVLMGWMPAPIELSAWQSLWIGAKERAMGGRMPMRGIRMDFYIGYGATVTLAVLFLALGALVMHGTGVEFAAGGAGFATQFVQLYVAKLGDWAGPFVAIAAFTTMLSTTITVVDAYPRSLSVGVAVLRQGAGAPGRSPWHLLWVIGLSAVGLLIIHSFRTELLRLLDLAAVIAFLAAPIFAYLNYRLVYSSHMPENLRPGCWLRRLSWCGLGYLILFGLLYLVWLGISMLG